MAPLLLYVPPLFGFEPLSMHMIAGLTIIQGLVACISGALTHRQFGFVSGRLSLYMGVSIFIAALAGGAGARYVSNEILLLIFGGLALSAAFLMQLPAKEDSERPDIGIMVFSRFKAVTTATVVGILGGLVGQGGSFILIPLMTYIVNIPIRIAIGSNLSIVMLSSSAAFIGKAMTGQIEWLMSIPIVLTVIPSAYLGSHASNSVSIIWLRRVLSLLVAIAALRIWIGVLSGR